VALGNFDGVHLGHQQVIAPILPDGLQAIAAAIPAAVAVPSDLGGYSDRCPWLLETCDGPDPPSPSGSQGAIPTVVTFYPHPREFFSGQPRPWLTPLNEKAAVLQAQGVKQLVLLPFNQELAHLSPVAFVTEVLIQRLQAQHIAVGADFRFGHDRTGTAAQLRQWVQSEGIEVTMVDLAEAGGDRISSSRIRDALGQGDLTTAHHLLGRPYLISGRVVRGQQLGRQMGFPTANLQVAPEKFLPCRGVYAVQVYGVADHPHRPCRGVMNLGMRPTVDGQRQTVEVHLLDWQGDLYGSTLTVALQRFLRPERRFDSLEQLQAQIQADCQTAAQAIVGDRSEVRA
jgi:riboflavin kinase/FMN adenylyltransferase